MGRAWNTAAIGLLALIAALVYFMPRFNYDLLVRRQALVESGFNTTLERIAKVEDLLEISPEKRSAALKALDGLTDRLKALQPQLAEVSDQVSVSLGELTSIDGRVKALEENRIGMSRDEARHEPPASNQDLTRWLRPDYTRAIDLPADLAAKARKLGPGAIADFETPDFIDKLIQEAIVEGAQPADLPPALIDRLHHLFQLYKTNISLLNASQDFYIHEEVERMTREGRFMEVPAQTGPVHATMGPDEVGIRHVKVFHETGLERIFDLPIGDHPQINAFNEMRANARDHLVLDAARTAEVESTAIRPSSGPR